MYVGRGEMDTDFLFKILFYCLQEALKCTVDVLDILGLYFVMTRLLGRTEMKIMVTAVGKQVVFHRNLK